MRSALVALVLLSACAAQQPPTPAPDAAGGATQQDTCGANRFRQLVGTRAADIDRTTLPPRARVIMPGQLVTMDYSAERLNIRVGPDGLVTEIGCF